MATSRSGMAAASSCPGRDGRGGIDIVRDDFAPHLAIGELDDPTDRHSLAGSRGSTTGRRAGTSPAHPTVDQMNRALALRRAEDLDDDSGAHAFHVERHWVRQAVRKAQVE